MIPMTWNHLVRDRQRHGMQDGLMSRTSVLNDDGMASCGCFVIFMTRKVLGSLSEASLDATKRRKMIAEPKNDFGKD